MAANYLHGVETIEVTRGSRPIQVVKSSVIALVGVAPKGPVNTPTLVLSDTDAAQFGNKVSGFSIPQALDAILKQGPATVVVVNTFNKLLNTSQVFGENATITNGKAKLAYTPVDDIVVTNNPTVSGETKATGTITVSALGTNGETVNVYAQDPLMGTFLLASYTKVSGDDTTTKVATAIASAINAATATTGYSAASSTNVVTVTVRAGLGASANTLTMSASGSGVTLAFTAFTGGVNGSATITEYQEGSDYTIDVSGNLALVAGSTITEGATVKVSYKKLESGSITNAQIIGSVSTDGTRTGIKAFELIYSTFGFTPKILIAPNYSQIAAIATELVSAANAYRAHTLLDAPLGTTVTGAIAGRGVAGGVGGFNTSSKRAILCYPHVKVYDVATDSNIDAPLSQYAAGVMSSTDLNEGYWVSPSNHQIQGIVGTERIITAGINNANSEANLLNEKGIQTVFNGFGTGFRLWGNRSAAFPTSTTPDNFIPVQRVADILSESVEFAMLDFIDQPINNATIDAIKESVNAFIRVLIGRGALVDGVCKFVAAKNPPEQIAAGQLVFDIDFMPPTPAERITFNAFIDINLLRALTVAA